MGFRDLSNKRTGSSWTDCFAREKLHQCVSDLFGVCHSTLLGHGHQSLLAYSNKEISRREDATLRSAINFGKPITHLKDL